MKRVPSLVHPEVPGPEEHHALRAFRQYVVPEMEVMLRVARSITRHEQDAEDLVQDTLLRAYRGIDRFDGANPRAWLLTILRNAQINRTRRRRPSLLHDPNSADRRAADTGGGREPEAEHLAGLLDEQLDQAVRALPDKFRAAIELIDLAGLSYEDAAAVLKVPAGTVMSRVHRGRLRLRRALEPRDGESSEVNQ